MIRTQFPAPLMAALGLAAALSIGACSENRLFERESASAQTKLAVPTSMTPPISVRGIDGAPDGWKLAERRPARTLPPQRAEAETPKRDVAARPERPRQIAESPAPRLEAQPAPRAEQYAETPGRAGYEYWIQVGSNKDEAASRAQWEKMQSAAQSVFANVGNRIQRADLGARGVYYRIQVGPFASPGTAGQFCAQLKARHIDCFLAQPEVATATTRPPEAAPKKAALPAPKPIAKPAETKPETPKPLAKPAEPKVTPNPVAKQAEPKPGATPGEKPKDAAAAPKKPDGDQPPALPDTKPPKGASAEKPDAPISTAPGLPGVLD